jgi:RepB DNA-primase from phage plasmid
MKEAGFNPAVIVETSPGNYQAWLKHAERLSKELSTSAARTLAENSAVIAAQPIGGTLGG